MKIPFKPLPDGEPLLDTQQFLFRLKHDPGFAGKMQAHYESMLALPVNDDTADMHQKAAAALRVLKHHQGAWNAMQALLQSQALMDEASDLREPDTLRRLRILADEATDHLLDVLEPDRTRLMTRIAGVREMIAKIAGKE